MNPEWEMSCQGKTHFLGDDSPHCHVASDIVWTCTFCSVCLILHIEAHVCSGRTHPGGMENLVQRSRQCDNEHKYKEVLCGPHLTHRDSAPGLKVGPYVRLTDVWIQLCDEQSVLLKTDKYWGDSVALI